MTTLVIIGSTGQLGTDIIKIFSQEKRFKLIPLTHKQIEVTDEKSINSVLKKIKPNVIINTSAFHKVEACEEQVLKSFEVNALGVKNLANFAKSNKCKLVHFSTDYVFGADFKRKKPYTESDCPAPINTYGLSKLAGEIFIKYTLDNYLIIRGSGLFGVAGASGKGGNFIETMLKKADEGNELKVVDDQILSPTSTLDIARNLLILIKKDAKGLFHMTGEGSCSWYSFANEIFKQTGKRVEIKPITSAKSDSPVRRPHYSVLENRELKKLGLNQMSNWKKSLKEYLQLKGYI